MIQRVVIALVVVAFMMVDAETCKPKQVPGHAAFIMDHNVNTEALDSLAGTCPCSSKKGGSWTRGFYPSNVTVPTFDINCTDMKQLCMYGTNKKPYKIYGNINSIQLFSYCVKESKCNFYVLPVCAVAADKKSGLKGGGKKLSCKRAIKKALMGKGAYLKVISASCGGCKKNPLKKAKCSLPYTAIASTTNSSGVVTTKATKAATAVTVPVDIGALSASDRQLVLGGHNSYRSQMANGQSLNGFDGSNLPQGSNVLKLVYDTTLEAHAKAWANRCVFEHTIPSNEEGESLFAMFTTHQVPTTEILKSAVDGFWGELASYGIDGLVLTSANFNRGIGHWSQMAWANTGRVGCAVNYCPANPPAPMTFVVCRYGPSGNYRNQNIYKTGTPCSACPAGASCDNGLCVV